MGGRFFLLIGAGGAMLLVLSGCPARTQLFSPRMTDSAAHQEAVQKKNCLGCHEVSKLKHHTPADDCTKCHIICKGC